MQNDRSATAVPWRLLAVYVFYVLAVYWPEPKQLSAVVFALHSLAGGSGGDLYYTLVALYAATPAILYFGYHVIGSGHPGHGLNSAIAIALHLFLAVAVLDVLLTVMMASFGGHPAVMAINTGSSLTVAIWAYLLAWEHTNGPYTVVKAPLFRIVILLYLALFTLWSAASMVRAGVQAVWLSGGSEFCIATPDHAAPGRSYGAIDSLFDLRGANLYTSATGYKHSSRWYFHAVLVAHDGDKFGGYGRRYWYWSIRQQTFVPYDAHGLWPISSRDACLPRPYFLLGM